jgi:hypothetical protein
MSMLVSVCLSSYGCKPKAAKAKRDACSDMPNCKSAAVKMQTSWSEPGGRTAPSKEEAAWNRQCELTKLCYSTCSEEDKEKQNAKMHEHHPLVNCFQRLVSGHAAPEQKCPKS